VETVKLFFVYGTLQEGWSNYERYVQPYSHEAIPAEIKGLLYDLPLGYPAYLEGDGVVKGVVLRFQPADYESVLAGLDDVETYYGPEDPRNEYERIEVLAKLAGEQEEKLVHAYRYVDEKYVRTVGTRIHDGDWAGFIRGKQSE
jgi:gamma-glutamylcyclotransferase (GGCT)/AIG2-like uncharacterized protein YtfP